MKLSFPLIVICLLTFSGIDAQINNQTTSAKPKLIVGIVVDQMRYDYLDKFYNKFSENGFKRIINDGYNCKNTNFNYVPTYTAPGHTSIYTGTTPLYHGVVGNNWYVRESGEKRYVTDDKTVHTIGSETKEVGEMSPRINLASTIGDEIRLESNMRSKVIAVSLKDRASILPGGKLSNGSYWFDGETGSFITSSYYMNKLPDWVVDFNKEKIAKKYLSKPWETLLPIEKYIESAPDNNPYEGKFDGEKEPVFPHNLPALYKTEKFNIIKSTPFGNSIVKDIAIAALKGEKLGRGDVTDFLAVSFSSTDYVGHQFGPQSVELEDTYLRLDRDIAELFQYMDEAYGKNNYLVFITADHAAAYVPAQLMDMKANAGYFDFKDLDKQLTSHLKDRFGTDSLISAITNQQIYLNHNVIKSARLNKKTIEEEIVSFVLPFEGVAHVYTSYQLNGPKLNNQAAALIQNGYYEKRSGDLAILLEPQWIGDYGKTGTTHGSPYTYDTHVPLLWYGWNIKHGETSRKIPIVDIAPTIAAMLNIMAPNACIGEPIKEIVK